MADRPTEGQPALDRLTGVRFPVRLPSFGRLSAQIAAAFATMQTAVQKAAQALNRFGEAFLAEVTKLYLQHHARLPGSDRTKRLRKKRRNAVLDWFQNHNCRECEICRAWYAQRGGLWKRT